LFASVQLQTDWVAEGTAKYTKHTKMIDPGVLHIPQPDFF
jgi:hypothetical protein